MSLYLGTQLLAGVAETIIYNAHTLLDFKWTDHELNDQSWLRADTFSWQDGTVYTNAYNHLVADYNGGTSQTETIGSYTITYVLATDGHKITTDETNVANIYNESGVAWYYILDTTNQRFKLPRENPAREVLGQSAPIMYGDTTKYHVLTQGDYSNAKGKKVVLIARSSTSSEAYVGYGDSTQTNAGPSILTDLTQETGIYKGKQYLYFYVGQFSQSATEQTAGLNSELFNDKVDLNLNNMNPSATAKETIVGWGMPDYTAIVSITSPYTAPSNGFIQYNHTARQTGRPKIDGIDVDESPSTGSNYDSLSLLFPIAKNSIFTFPQNHAEFIPCKGVQQ